MFNRLQKVCKVKNMENGKKYKNVKIREPGSLEELMEIMKENGGGCNYGVMPLVLNKTKTGCKIDNFIKPIL